ncbi:MAG: hypothetical protein ACYCVV_17815, partial [Acidimicrobiales bacterium]
EDGRAILARAARPASGHLLGPGVVTWRPLGQVPLGQVPLGQVPVGQVPGEREAGESVLMWASAAPAVSVGSRAGRVSAPRTRPGWSPSR